VAEAIDQLELDRNECRAVRPGRRRRRNRDRRRAGARWVTVAVSASRAATRYRRSYRGPGTGPRRVSPAVWVRLSGLLTLSAGSTISASGPAARLSRASIGPPRRPNSTRAALMLSVGRSKGRQGKHPAEVTGSGIGVGGWARPARVLREEAVGRALRLARGSRTAANEPGARRSGARCRRSGPTSAERAGERLS
jgi:hypothetical protein